MEILHAKSPCCRGRINHFGRRRRQCSVCKRTWRIRQKRRGRKPRRNNPQLAVRILLEHRTFRHHRRKGTVSQSGFSRRLSKSIKSVLESQPLTRFPPQPCALLGDGLYFKFKRVDWVMYLMAVKPAHDHKAYFLDPILLKGRECYERWTQAVASIPQSVKKHIRAFVSDGFRGSQLLSEQNRWLHQRCHFHLLANLVRGKGKRRYRTRSSRLRDKLLEATRIILNSQSTHVLVQARRTICRLINRPTCPPYIRKQALEFLEREQDFRTHLAYPELHLPTTTSAIESLGKMIRKATNTAPYCQICATSRNCLPEIAKTHYLQRQFFNRIKSMNPKFSFSQSKPPIRF